MDAISQRFARSNGPGPIMHKRLRQLTAAGFIFFLAKGLLWLAAAVWLVS